MLDYIESNFEKDSPNIFFMKNNSSFNNPLEKETYFKTENLLDDENDFPDMYGNDFFGQCSSFENEDFRDDNRNACYFFNKEKEVDKSIKTENEILTEGINKNIVIEEKKIIKNENIKKVNDIVMRNDIKEQKEEEIEIKKDEQKKKGRIKFNSNLKGEHNKKSGDNIINKIKGNFFNTFIRAFIKYNSINKDIQIKKLPNSYIADLSKENNERLFDKTISEILCEQEISSKYSTFDKFENKKIILKILKENKETNVKKILNLTFEEAFILYRNEPEDKEKLEEMKDKIEGLNLFDEDNNYIGFQQFKKELKKKHEDEYIEKVKNTCLGYKNWFNNKNKRK